MNLLVALVAGYLLGSLPIANAVASHRADIDLRTVGDRNPGYWNARSVLGRRAAATIFVGDAAKGTAGGLIGLLAADAGQWWMAYAGVGAAMVGHAWPVFAGFRGGRGVLTFAGGACVLSPVTAAIAIGMLFVVFAATRSFAVAARVAVFGFPVVQLVVDGPERTAATGVLMCLIGLRFAMAQSTGDRATADTG